MLSGNKPEKRICTALLAHVDAGKTTLSEGMLYAAGNIRRMGRVDNQDAFLDTDGMERARGITIFSKQAMLRWKDMELTLLDTPGHVDFSAEMERTLQALDYAVLLVSGADGVQAHTRTLWRLLSLYGIPVFLFVNKMDQDGTDKGKLLKELQEQLDGNCVDFTVQSGEDFYDAVAMCGEAAMEQFLEEGTVSDARIRDMIAERTLFPCFFGSALKYEGVTEFLDGLAAYVKNPRYPEEFAAKVFKIARDAQGNRLTYMKITGGVLRVRDVIKTRGEDGREEKVNQIRIYSGEKYEAVNQAEAGTVCAVTGLTGTKPGEGYGAEPDSETPLLAPVLTYRILLPPEIDAAQMLPKLRQIEEEEPELHIVWDERLQEIQAQLMGEVQLEVLEHMVAERFGVAIGFGEGNIVYKETIADTVEGVGHFEPLRHYAEVHLLLEPGEEGSGLQFASACSADVLDRNWQRLVLTHLEEREHKGVLTGSALTDVKITLLTGRAHLKHTEGGDFRQATYRAVRQGLMQAQSVLLEPYYRFRLTVPEAMVGRAMTDIEHMHGQLAPFAVKNGMAELSGRAPVVSMRGYQKEVTVYTKGLGHLQCAPGGYSPCHNAQEVVERIGYQPDADLANPSSSVFCSHGAGMLVEWQDVRRHMHVESAFVPEKKPDGGQRQETRIRAAASETVIGTEEIDAILARTFSANKRDKVTARYKVRKRKRVYDEPRPAAAQEVKKRDAGTVPQKEYFLVDGYNIIFAWGELNALAADNIDGARGRLLDIMCNYQAIRKCDLIVVFDAYRVEGHPTEYYDYHNIHVVYTKEAETADQYIERFAHENAGKYRVTVATSDGLEQIIIRGAGCLLVSARELEADVRCENERMQKEYMPGAAQGRNRPFESVLKSGMP